MLRRALAAALLLTATPCLADDSPVPGVLEEFGLLGTWALDCALPPSATDEHALYKISASGEATVAYTRGTPYRDIVYVIHRAERLAGDRVALRVSGISKITVDLVLLKADNTIRVWSSHGPDGRMLVIDGVITGNGAESPRFKRCNS